MVIKRVSPMSFAKIEGAMGVLMGLLIGLFFAAGASLFTSIASRDTGSSGLGFMGAAFGVTAIIVMPIVYGVCGFIFGLIGAVLYNWVAGMVGGIEIETA